MQPPPSIAKQFGITKQAVAQRKSAALKSMGD